MYFVDYIFCQPNDTYSEYVLKNIYNNKLKKNKISYCKNEDTKICIYNT